MSRSVTAPEAARADRPAIVLHVDVGGVGGVPRAFLLGPVNGVVGAQRESARVRDVRNRAVAVRL